MANPIESPALNVENIYEQYRHLFSEEAQKAFEVITKELLHQRNELLPNGDYVRVIDKVHFLGMITTKNEIPEVVAILASKINLLAANGWLTATLAPLMTLEMARSPIATTNPLDTSDNTINGETKYAVLTYVAITQVGEHFLNTWFPHLSFREGSVPNQFSKEADDKECFVTKEDMATYAISEE